MVFGMDLLVCMDAKQLLKIFFKLNVCPTISAEIYSMGMAVGIFEKVPALIGFTKRKMRRRPSYRFSTGHRIYSRISAVQNVLGDFMHFMLFLSIKFGSLQCFITGNECL